MKTKVILTISIIFLFCFISCQKKQDNLLTLSEQSHSQENLDGSITIQGRVTLKGNKKVPLGVTTINVKNKWAFSKDITKFLKEESPQKTIAYGENKRVFINKEGYYKITIDKNDTLAIIADKYLYKQPKYITGLTKNKIINVELEPLNLEVVQNFGKKNPSAYKIYYEFLNTVNQDSLVTISGIISNQKTKTPLENIYITTSFINNTTGSSVFHFTDKHGQFSMKTPKNSLVTINNLSSKSNVFKAKNDTIINLYL
ncbi:hypothetical protein HX038_15420 [Myroides odoratimimus]|uniref:hypothetical protein n=1 Tax=Myroides odoratimimus TaxID=76832 RepID=UPI002577282A|nr:hypothetical protein [Myroides odoratimimus]MDM1412125.1 hypothetical protein [Myroides odoratimimus]